MYNKYNCIYNLYIALSLTNKQTGSDLNPRVLEIKTYITSHFQLSKKSINGITDPGSKHPSLWEWYLFRKIHENFNLRKTICTYYC